MTPKSITVLSVVTAISIAAAVASLNINRDSSASVQGGALFPELLDTMDGVSKITVTDKDRETTVSRTSGGIWGVNASDGYPASISNVQKSILQVAQLLYLEKKTANKKLYERLQLEGLEKEESLVRRIQFFDAQNNVLADLFLGKKRFDLTGATSAGAYVRKPDDPQTWLVSGEIDFQTELKSWLQNSILNIREENVLKAEIRHPDGEIVRISKKDPKNRNFTLHNIPEGKKLKYESDPNNIANVVENLEMLDARKGKKFNFIAKKTVTATYTSRNGLVADLALLKLGEDDWLKVKLTVSTDPPKDKNVEEIVRKITERTHGWVFKIPGFKAERLRRDAAKMLVEKKTGS